MKWGNKMFTNILESIPSESKNVTKWTDDVVYGVYRNDNLEDLPIAILFQMRNHIESIMMNKYSTMINPKISSNDNIEFKDDISKENGKFKSRSTMIKYR